LTEGEWQLMGMDGWQQQHVVPKRPGKVNSCCCTTGWIVARFQTVAL